MTWQETVEIIQTNIPGGMRIELCALCTFQTVRCCHLANGLKAFWVYVCLNEMYRWGAQLAIQMRLKLDFDRAINLYHYVELVAHSNIDEHGEVKFTKKLFLRSHVILHTTDHCDIIH